MTVPTPQQIPSATILITGGSGDLGAALTAQLVAAGHRVLRMDPRPPTEPHPAGEWIEASILDRPALARAIAGIDAVVHAAAWHGIHEGRALATPDDFWDLNMTGTANVLHSLAANAPQARLVLVSSTSVSRAATSLYGLTKALGEDLLQWHIRNRGLRALILRPPSFIPPTRTDIYPDYATYAREYWGRSAMDVSDVAGAAHAAIQLLLSPTRRLRAPAPLTAEPVVPVAPPPILLGDRDDIPAEARAAWDSEGPGTSFRRLFPEFANVAERAGLQVARPPLARDLAEARRALRWSPRLGIRDVLARLARESGA